MREIVDIGSMERGLRLAAVVLPILGVVLSLVIGFPKKRLAYFMARIGAAGLIGPLLFGMWRIYSYLVRYEPETGYSGLTNVRALLFCLLLFAVVGGLIGLIAASLASRFR